MKAARRPQVPFFFRRFSNKETRVRLVLRNRCPETWGPGVPLNANARTGRNPPTVRGAWHPGNPKLCRFSPTSPALERQANAGKRAPPRGVPTPCLGSHRPNRQSNQWPHKRPRGGLASLLRAARTLVRVFSAPTLRSYSKGLIAGMAGACRATRWEAPWGCSSAAGSLRGCEAVGTWGPGGQCYALPRRATEPHCANTPWRRPAD